MSAKSMTTHRHNDYVGGEASKARIPGADKAASGHQYEAIFPKESQSGVKHAQENLPPTTDRDRLPAADVHLTQHDHNADPTIEHLVSRTTGEPHSLPPAPDSRTVIDRDPYAPPTRAEETLGGATSRDVHGGLGVPGSGMSSQELRHDGKPHPKRGGQGAYQYGSGEIPREIQNEAEQREL